MKLISLYDLLYPYIQLSVDAQENVVKQLQGFALRNGFIAG